MSREFLRRVRKLAHNASPYAGLGRWDREADCELVVRSPLLCDVAAPSASLKRPPPIVIRSPLLNTPRPCRVPHARRRRR